MARAHCRRLLLVRVRASAARILTTAGRIHPASPPRIAMTMTSSMSLNPRRVDFRMGNRLSENVGRRFGRVATSDGRQAIYGLATAATFGGGVAALGVGRR